MVEHLAGRTVEGSLPLLKALKKSSLIANEAVRIIADSLAMVFSLCKASLIEEYAVL